MEDNFNDNDVRVDIFREIKQKKLYEEVVDQITNLILSQRLQPGDKLPTERELASILSVSRTSLREALKTLEQRHLVEVRHGAGVFVRTPSIEAFYEPLWFLTKIDEETYFETMEVRGFIEVEIVGCLAERATNEDLERMTKHINRMRELLDSPEEFTKEDLSFHMVGYQAMENRVLSMFMVPMISLLGEFMVRTFDAPGSTESSLRRHEELLDCIKAHDQEGARHIMRKIISHGMDRLKDAIELKSVNE